MSWHGANALFLLPRIRCQRLLSFGGLNRNLRNELKKSKKIYFYDTGVRSAVIQQFAHSALRDDTGALWENFFIVEQVKRRHYGQHFYNTYFWRTNRSRKLT